MGVLHRLHNISLKLGSLMWVSKIIADYCLIQVDNFLVVNYHSLIVAPDFGHSR